MKYFLILVLTVLMILLGQTAKALDYELEGYVKNLPVYQDLPAAAAYFGIDTGEDYFLMDINRLRLRPTVWLGDNSRVTMHYELDFLASKVALPYLTGSEGMTNRQALDLHWNIVDEEYFSAQHYIDMLYFKQMFDWGEMTLGRQVVSWGSGRVWQPTDLFNPINPANFSKFEKDGADMFSAKCYLGDFSDLEAVVNFREIFKDYNYAARLRTNYEEYDIALMAGYFDRNTVVGGDFAGNLFDAGFRGEAIYVFDKDDSDSNYLRFILGLDYQFTAELYGMIEYQYNGEGKLDKEKYEMGKLMTGEILNVSRNYITAMAMYQFHPLVTGNISTMNNLNDGSGYAGATATYNALTNLNVSLGAMAFYGSELSEYWYYSTAVYMNFEYYFSL